jgi:signal transduction histidine kinase
VVLRWGTWLISLAIVLLGAVPTRNLQNAATLLAATAFQTAVFTLYLPVLRPLLRRRLLSERVDQVLIGGSFAAGLDILASLLVIWLSGGWGSPFYEYALLSVLMPSLLLGYRGAVAAAAAFTIGYALIVLGLPESREIVLRAGSLDAFVSQAANPWLVGLFVAYLSQVQAGLQRETERAREALRRNQELQRQQEALVAQQERSRIAREIHDGIAQSLYMLSLNLETVSELAERGDTPRLKARLEALVTLSKQALWEVRQYIYDLKPLLRGDQSLSAVLANQVREFGTVSGLRVDLQVRGPEGDAAGATRAALYRIAQEALANVFKHAQASQVWVTLAFEDGEVCLALRDDGKGISSESGRGHGLESMAERARACGGSLRAEALPGSGTVVEARLPVAGRRSTGASEA